MKTKSFFKHIGLAAGYLLFFMLLQGWVAALFSFGMMMGSIGHPASSAEMLDSIWQAADQILQFNDVIMLLFYVGCIAFYLCFLFAETPSAPLRTVRLGLPRRIAMMWTPLVLGTGFFFAVQGCMMLIPEDSSMMLDYSEAVSVLGESPFPTLSFIATVYGAPMIEELVFRGMVYRHLKRAVPVWLALLIQASLFAYVHGQLLWMLYTFVLGAVFGLLYDYFDNLWPCILAHMCFNACNYLPFLEDLSLEPVGWVIVLLASLLLCALTLLLMLLYRRYSAERRPLAHD